MDITRDIILDLIPLYLADEVSDDSRAAVDHYLSANPDLALQIETLAAAPLDAIPQPLSKESEMDAYKKVRRIMLIRTLGLAVIIAGAVLTLVLVAPLIYMFVF